MTQRWRDAINKIRSWVVTNWPIKITALVLAAVLWAATAAQEPTEQLVPVRLEVRPPDGRALSRTLPQVQALYTGSARALINLFAEPPIIRREIPDSVTGSSFTLELSPDDLSTSDGLPVRAEDVQPRMITVHLDELMQRTLPVLPRVTVAPESGYVRSGEIVILPESLTVRGPRSQVRRLETLYTRFLALTNLTEPVQRTLPVDTTGLSGVVRLSQRQVDVRVNVVPLVERVLDAVPVVIAGGSGGWESVPPVVRVVLRGPRPRVERLTIDSVAVRAPVTGSPRQQTVPVEVEVPAGITATAQPDTVIVRRRGSP